ncbi:protein kinase [Plasmodium cynomolgi strain B]|uniref:Protein kinase n=1 Tax=Plasmodium cynomolgi (strain B) TaxID=1120755 RepID=K6UX75_PLACD|nr:protein kinase [Plasmodium cynomolgi strain B]GAB67030.1 protein kinase [Plasmodium cynomolgi strain B]
MLQYFVDKLFGDLPANFNFVIGKRLECQSPQNGGYYEIYEGVNKNNEGVCIFIYDKKGKAEGSREKRYTSNHLAFSKKLIHPNILKVLYTYESDKRIYIVTEKCVPLHIEGECIPKRLLPLYSTLLKYSKKEINMLTILNDESLRTDNTISTMLFLTQIHMKSKSEKVQFLDNLFSKLENISSNVKTEKILPELVQNVEVSESRVTCLKIILTISRELSTEHFDKMIFPTVSKYFSLNDRSIRFVLLENLHHIERHLTSNHMNEIYNSYLYGFLDNNTSIKNESIKNFIYVFPKLKSNFKSSSLMALLDNLRDSDFCVKTNTIICVAKIAKHILEDKEKILENVYKVGLQESFIQTRLATIQAVKFTYDQFSAKKYASNILPLLVRSLIDDSVEVRLAAFDAMDSVCVQLRGDLLRGNSCSSSRSPPIPSGTSNGNGTSTSAVDSLKGYTFINKIKGIITAKGELDSGNGSRATQEGGLSVGDFSGRAVQTGATESDPLSTLVYDVPPVGGALGATGSRAHLNVNSQTGVYNSGERHVAAFQHQSYDQRDNFIFEEEMKNYRDRRRGWGAGGMDSLYGGGDTPGEGDRGGHYEQGKHDDYYNCELVSMNRLGETNQEGSLFDGNFHLGESARRTAHGTAHGTSQGTAPQTAQTIDLDIDDFFKEFDLKEDSSVKVKLSSL